MSLRQNLQSFKSNQLSSRRHASQSTGALGAIKQHKVLSIEIITAIAILGIATAGATSMQTSSNNPSQITVNKNATVQSANLSADTAPDTTAASAETPDPSNFNGALGNYGSANTTESGSSVSTSSSSNLTVNGQQMTIPTNGTSTQTVTTPGGNTNVTITSNQSSSNGDSNNGRTSTNLNISTRTTSNNNVQSSVRSTGDGM